MIFLFRSGRFVSTPNPPETYKLTTAIQSAVKMPPSIQSHPPTRPQPRPLRPRLQIHHALPTAHLAHQQRTALRFLPRRSVGRLHSLRPHHTQLCVPANRHLRRCARLSGTSETSRATQTRWGSESRRSGYTRGRRLGVNTE
jgi:hypothetical protein